MPETCAIDEIRSARADALEERADGINVQYYQGKISGLNLALSIVMRLSKACGQFASRETEKQSPLQERGFRLIDKELWEKQLEDPRIPGYRAIHMTGKPPKRTRWMVDTREDNAHPLNCANCECSYPNHWDVDCCRITGKTIGDCKTNGTRHSDCPAVEVECEG